MSCIDVIVPVYEGYDQLVACLESVLGAEQCVQYECIVIDDCSPNKRIREYLGQLAEAGKITLLANAKNQGFVRTVNRGMSLHADRDVVLLNSDTRVANNWLDRLYQSASGNKAIGTLTPFSNNAEICSFPQMCVANHLPAGLSLASLDGIFAEQCAGQVLDLPTAVGFCMYIKRACLDETGLFDADTYGLGYGEENDFCMRSRASGWTHGLAADCFVFHEGGASFSERKQAMVARAMAVLDRKYPHYHADVRSHIAADPAYPVRCKALIEALRLDRRKKFIAITHNSGGGTEKHVSELASCMESEVAFVSLRPSQGSLLRLSLQADQDGLSLVFDWHQPREREDLLALCNYLGIERAHLHHILGLETVIVELLTALNVDYDLTLHDYYLIGGNPTLTDAEGRYCVDPEARGEGCVSVYPLDSDGELKSWHEQTQRLLALASRVIAPSSAALVLYRDSFGVDNAVLSWHPDMMGVERLPVTAPSNSLSTRPMKVLVLGALGREKGADLLEAVAKLARTCSELVNFTLLGYAYQPLPECVDTLGPYRDEQLEKLIQDTQADLIWFPCLWPETYSYTLSAAMRSGLPMVVPNLGSFPERVSGRPHTWLQDWDVDAEEYLRLLLQVREDLCAEAGTGCASWQLPRASEFCYLSDYALESLPPPAAVAFDLDRVQHYMHHQPEIRGGGWKGRVLLLLIVAKQHPWLAWLVRLIPFNAQRALKRKLSRRPLHDIVA